MVLRLEAEEVTQYTDDLDAEAKRDLLACLLHSVDEVLLFFRTVRQICICCSTEKVATMAIHSSNHFAQV